MGKGNTDGDSSENDGFFMEMDIDDPGDKTPPAETLLIEPLFSGN